MITEKSYFDIYKHNSIRYCRLQNHDSDKFQVVVEEEDYVFESPDSTLYKDLNSSTTINVNQHFLQEYYKQFDCSYNQKGQQMYEQKYLLTLRKAAVNGCNFFVGRVSSEYRKRVVYAVNAKFSTNGFVSEVECECAAGRGPIAYCKHICVTFEAIKDFSKNQSIVTRETCTSRLQTFHTTKRYTGSPKKIKQLELKKNSDYKSLDWDPRPVMHRTNDQEYRDFFRNKCISFAAYSKDPMPILQAFPPANLKAVFDDHDYEAEHPQTVFLKKNHLIAISYEEIARIEQNTRDQSTSKEWMSQRSMRLNSSTFGKIVKCSDEKKMTEELLRQRNLDNVVAVAHGKRYESEARSEFTKLKKLEVSACGTFISKPHPFLASSPDGLVGEEATLEIKCPYSARNQKISTQTVPYLFMCENDNCWKLNSQHNYHYQIQGQMYCAEKRKAYFVVYTIEDIVVLEIERDDNFIDSMVARLENFFVEHFQQAVLNRFLYRNDR